MNQLFRTKTDRKTENKRKFMLDSRQEYFVRNGGILLEKHISLSQGLDIGSGQLKILTLKDIEKATNNYDPSFFVGDSAQRSVYKAIFEDRVAVVGVPLQMELNPKMIDRNLSEASLAMVMNHDNIVKLYGCCLDTLIPILVYDMMPNGLLSNHLHDYLAAGKCIKWADCLRVATEAAYALSYMHNALRKPLVHRGFSSRSILLDSSFHAKIGNFGYAVSITPGDTSKKWPVEGLPGFVDPEYIETQLVTEKCDVYSFGVLLLELLTRSNPIRMFEGGRDLVDVFVSAVQKNCMMNMIDREVLKQASRNEIQLVAEIAMSCVAKKGFERPTMIEIVVQLRQIQGREDVNQLTRQIKSMYTGEDPTPISKFEIKDAERSEKPDTDDERGNIHGEGYCGYGGGRGDCDKQQ